MKKGFTLTELIATIMIIGVLLLIAIPSILGVINNEKESLSKTMEDVILKAGELYIRDNIEDFPETEGNTYCVLFQQLIDSDYLNEKLKDPVSNNDIDKNQYVKIAVKNGKYEYEIADVCTQVNETEDRPYIYIMYQTPENTEYAQSKEIKIKYLSKKLTDSHYYIKTSEEVKINNVISYCGSESLPISCTPSTEGTLQPDTWYELEDTTTFTIEKNMIIRAIMKNNSSYSKGIVYKETKIDSTKPSVSIAVNSIKTDRATVVANCEDPESGIIKYEYSKDNGTNWVTGTGKTHTFKGLNQGTAYAFAVRCTNGAELTEEKKIARATPSIVTPIISQYSQEPKYSTYAQNRTIKIEYIGANIQNPKFYFKSTVDTQVTEASTSTMSSVIAICGNSTEPSNCIETTTTTLKAGYWYLAGNTVQGVLFKTNGLLYAKTTDESGNEAVASTYTVTNVDSTAPTVSITGTTLRTDRVTITANCTDSDSNISKYEFSKDGTNWVSTGTVKAYTFYNLKQNTEYTFKVRCTNASGLTATSSKTATTASIIAPTISQYSQTPSGTTYAQKRIIRITFDGTNISNPTYYYSLDGTNWTQVTSTTQDVTFTSNGKLYAKTVDATGNLATASTYTVVNVDTTLPTTTVSVSGKTATFTLKDNIGIEKYGISQSDSIAPTYTTITSTTSTSKSYTATTWGTFYIWSVDNAGNIGKTSFVIEPSAFNYAATYKEGTYSASIVCSNGTTLSGTDCKKSVTSESQCGCKTYKYCQNSSCGSTTNTCATPACGVASYNYCFHENCGVYVYYTCEHAECGTDGYKTCANSACGCASYTCSSGTLSGTSCTSTSTSYQSTSQACAQHCNSSAMSYVSYSSQTRECTCKKVSSATCSSYKSCATSACGVKYKSCATAGCGVWSYNYCQNEACGVASYNSCQNSACGTTTNSCRTSGCGCETANTCSVTDNSNKSYTCQSGDTRNGTTCSYARYVCENGGTLNSSTNICEFS